MCTVHQLETMLQITTPFEIRRAGDIAILRDAGIGDLLMTTPALRALKGRYPELSITYYTQPGNRSVLEGNPHIDAIRALDEYRDDQHPLTVDLRGYVEGHPAANSAPRAEIFGAGFGLDLTDLRPEMHLDSNELRLGEAFVSGMPRPLIGVAPHTTARERNWDDASSTIPQLIDRGTVIWFSWEDMDQALHPVGSQYSAREWAAIIRNLDVLITADSGPLHLAHTMQVMDDSPTPGIVGLFGVARAELIVPNARNFVALQTDRGCSPCWHNSGNCEMECKAAHDTDSVLLAVDFLLAAPEERNFLPFREGIHGS
jgi:ADP-heptose:LPS heptosyltransferase